MPISGTTHSSARDAKTKLKYLRYTNQINICKGTNIELKLFQVKLPYAAKLLFQELMSMNIAPRLMVET